MLCGLGAGAAVGYLIYKGGNKTSLQIFLVASTCFLYLVAAGLFSKGVWSLEQNAWVKIAGEGAAEAGAGPGSYDIRKSVWHVNVSPITYHPRLVWGGMLTRNSAAHLSRMAMEDGVFSTRFSDGRIALHMALSFRTISTGSSSLLASCSWAGRRTSRTELRMTKLLARRRVSRETPRERRRAKKASLLRLRFEKFTSIVEGRQKKIRTKTKGDRKEAKCHFDTKTV